MDLIAVIVALAAIVFAVVGAWAHRAVGTEEGRATIIGWLESGRWRDRYHDMLRSALDWLDQTIDPPPFARQAPTGGRWIGMLSLGVCVTVSITYNIVAMLIGWVAGGPSALGDVILLGETLREGWLPDGPGWLSRLSVVIVFGCVMAFSLWLLRGIFRSVNRLANWLEARPTPKRPLSDIVPNEAAVPVSVAVLVAVAVVVTVVGVAAGVEGGAGAEAEAGAIAMAGILAVGIPGIVAIVATGARDRAVAVVGPTIVAIAVAMGAGGAVAVAVGGAGAGAVSLGIALFCAVLPIFNGVLDWISLSVSRWFGRAIVAERASPGALAWVVLLALADLIAATAFLFAITWLLAFAVESLGGWLDVALELDSYISEALAYPWSRGLWASVMVLSTLLPTAVHFVLALGALWFAWFGNSVGRWCAGRLRAGNSAHYLPAELYLVFGWMAPVIVVPLAMGWGLYNLFLLVEPLPDAIFATALHGIDTARAWYR